ncbi:MAG TPA: hypothetical protein VI076_06500 [Actinopolymorphaceae bacterium]
MTTTPHPRTALAAMYVGLGLTVVALIVPFTGDVLADHIRAGYPDYTQAQVDSAVTTGLVVLSVVGVLGIVGWLWTIRAVETGKRWARLAASALFVLGTCTALATLFVEDTSGDTGFPLLVGGIGTLPCLAGLVAVALLWRGPSPEQR